MSYGVTRCHAVARGGTRWHTVSRNGTLCHTVSRTALRCAALRCTALPRPPFGDLFGSRLGIPFWGPTREHLLRNRVGNSHTYYELLRFITPP